MSMFPLLGMLATTALAALAIAAGTIVVLGLLVGLAVWLSGARPARAPRRS